MVWLSAIVRILAAVLILAGGWLLVSRLGESSRDGTRSVVESIETLEEHVAAHPEDAESFGLLGKLHLIHGQETGDLESSLRAERHLRRALGGIPDEPRLRGMLAEALLGQQRHREALALAQEIRQEHPEDLRTLTVIGDAQRELGRYDEAEQAFETLRRVRAVPAILARLARLAEIRGDWDRARSLLEEALASVTRDGRGPDAAWFLAGLCELHLGRGDVESARPLCEEARSLREDASTLRLLARLHSTEERWAEAIALYEAANLRLPDPGVHGALAEIHEITGDAARAERERAAAIALAERSPIPGVHRRLLASILVDREGGASRALELARDALAEHDDVYTWDLFAYALLRNDHPREAADASARALALDTPEPAFHYHAGLIHHALGDDATARRHLERALALNPRFSPKHAPKARALLAKISPDSAARTPSGGPREARGVGSSESGPRARVFAPCRSRCAEARRRPRDAREASASRALPRAGER